MRKIFSVDNTFELKRAINRNQQSTLLSSHCAEISSSSKKMTFDFHLPAACIDFLHKLIELIRDDVDLFHPLSLSHPISPCHSDPRSFNGDSIR